MFLLLLVGIFIVGCEQESFTLQYNTNGHGGEIEEVTNIRQLPETFPVLTEEGFHFDGWYTDSTFEDPAVAGAEMTQNVILYAKWTELFTIKFEMNQIGRAHV